MSVIQIREAKREGARLVIGLQGISGSGKTYTALQLAYGMAGFDARKVGFLDTENRRGSLYADSLRHPETGEIQRFLIGDLTPPFSPQRYIEAIQAFEQAGVDVLIIDSVSHEWAGQGGCYDIAKNTSKRIDDWLTAKNEHKRFMSAMLQSSMHIIACIREAPKTDFKDPKNPKALGLMPIQESQFVFELTASVQMWNAGRDQAVLKCPDELMPILGRGRGYITADDGKLLRDWVDGAQQQEDPKITKFRHRLQAVTENGVEYVRNAWSHVPDEIKAALGEKFQQQIEASAREFDAQRAAGSGQDQDLDDLNSRIMGASEKGESE